MRSGLLEPLKIPGQFLVLVIGSLVILIKRILEKKVIVHIYNLIHLFILSTNNQSIGLIVN